MEGEGGPGATHPDDGAPASARAGGPPPGRGSGSPDTERGKVKARPLPAAPASDMRVVVIGGGAAGMAAASRVRRLSPESEVVVVERTGYVSFALCGIPYYVGGLVRSLDDLMYYPAKFFEEKRGIRLELGAEVESIDASGRSLSVRRGEEVFELGWDRLIVATGAMASRPPVPGVDLDGVLTVHHLDEGAELRRRLARARRVVVVGAGLNGLEFAENVARLGKEVHVVEMFDQLLPRALDPDAAGVLLREVGSPEGVRFHLGEGLEEVSESGSGGLRVQAGGETLEADLVLLFTGIRPSVDLLREAGAEVGETGAVRVSPRMETSLDGVYAAGDAVEVTNRVTGRPDWFPFAQVANKTGLVAGANAAGRPVEFPGAVGTWTARVFGVEVAGTGLTETRARAEGLDPEASLIRAPTRAHYIPGAGESHLWVKAVSSGDGRLLGVQAVGPGALARVNVAAALLGLGAGAEELLFADLGYAPPLAPVWDPLVVAGRRLHPIL